MQNVQNISSLEKGSIVEYLFLSWLFCLPFGSKIGGVSVGFLTIYPSLILLFAMIPVAMSTLRHWHPTLKYLIAFLFIWVLFGIAYPKIFTTEFHAEWKFDVRSLALQFLTVFTITGVYYKLGKERFLGKLKGGVFFFLLLIISFGFFEFYSGVHFQGAFTDKLLSLDAVSELYYAPVFVYDNPNDFMVYLILVLFLYLLLSDNGSNKWKPLAVLILAFLFALATNARIAQYVIFLLAIAQLLRVVWSPIKDIKKEFIFTFLIGTVGVFLLFLNNPVFLGPKYKKGQLDTNGTYIEFPLRENSQDKLTSFELRKNLLLNGVTMIKENPFFGLGPGGFKKRHLEKSVPNPTETIVGPHNYPIELVAGYGIFGWVMLAFFGILFLFHLRKSIRRREFNWITFSIPVFLLCSILPSSFLYMDINWVFLSIIIILTVEGTEKHIKNERT